MNNYIITKDIPLARMEKSSILAEQLESITDVKLPKYMMPIMYWRSNVLKLGFKVEFGNESDEFLITLEDVTSDFDSIEVLGKIIDNKKELYNMYVDAFDFLVENVPDDEFDDVIGDITVPTYID